MNWWISYCTKHTLFEITLIKTYFNMVKEERMMI